MVGEYVDDGWSGTNFERPSFQRMMDDVDAGKVNCIVTKDLSRFGREHVMMDYSHTDAVLVLKDILARVWKGQL